MVNATRRGVPPSGESCRLEVWGPWAGQARTGWGPAISGVLNRTHHDDVTASTFPTISEAMNVLDRVVLPAHPQAVRLVAADGWILFALDLQ